MSALDASIKEIDQKIERMYDEEELRQLEYQLHAVMVHEGGVDSGHYWAYVKDHKKQVCEYKLNSLMVHKTNLTYVCRILLANPYLFFN